METTSSPRWAGRMVYALTVWLICFSFSSFAQVPTVTTRLANPFYDCPTGEYCMDVEFQSDAPGVELFGMNVRFFYDDANLELIGFSDFQGGYGPVMPDPPDIMMTIPGTGTAFFNFPPPGVADFVNGAIQLVDDAQPPIFLSTVGWTKLFQMCFLVEGPLADSVNFCPPIVLDLQEDPSQGGYLPGDDGIVITVVAPSPVMSAPAIENVVQFNWDYSGPGTPPYGEPQPTECVVVGCFIDLALEKTLIGDIYDFSPGDDVDFSIEVTNEGEIPVGEIHLIDYIPVGFALNDPDWTAGMEGSTGQSASIVLSIANTGLPPGGLLPNASVSVEITLSIDENIPSGEYLNIAEISLVYDNDGLNVSGNDIDSTPDADDTNDLPAEDDHDVALICLLQPPGIIGDLFVCPGETITYEVENYNPLHTYIFSLLNGGGFFSETTDSSATVVWDNQTGGPYELQLVESGPLGCVSDSSIFINIEAPGEIACINALNISIDNDCGTVITSGMILTGEMEGNNTFEVFIIDMNGDTVPNATLSWEHVGQTFKVSVRSRCNGQSCWGWITVEDKLGPIIDCVCPVDNDDITCSISCMEIDQFIQGNIPDELRPTVIDNCGGTTLVLDDVQLNHNPCGGGYLLVDWLATDGSGNTSTCRQEFHILPMTLATLEFPDDYFGECGDDPHPSNTGWPQIDGHDLVENSGYCNILRTYTDRIVEFCGGGIKIVRTWKVTDWCLSRHETDVQMIHLGDHIGPVLTCPEDMTVSTGIVSCDADVIVSKPGATDACSDIVHYQLSYSGGIVEPIGNTYILRDLPVGEHLITWKVTDECYNYTTCSFTITVVDDIPPSVSCHLHTVVGLTSWEENGLTIVSAEVFDDGSFDNCSNLTFRARRMDSCLEFDWTTDGACFDGIPGGIPAINNKDRGTDFGPCVPFACCDVGNENLMVELEVSDESGNKNYCMVEVVVQDKLAPELTCPQNISLSCAYPLVITEGIFSDVEGNNNGSLDEDPLSALFGNMLDAARFDQSDRQPIIINDPDNPNVDQPYQWGMDGWARDNCPLALSVEVRVTEDCTGENIPGTPPQGIIKVIERIFRATDGTTVRACTQRIWVINYDPYFITDTTCQNENPLDGIIWPCDVTVEVCPEEDDVSASGEPVIVNTGCNHHIGTSHEDTPFEDAEGACIKVIREWKILDWCQYNEDTGSGIWTYQQEIKVAGSNQGGILEGEITTEQSEAVSQVSLSLKGPQGDFPEQITTDDGKFMFANVPPGEGYIISPQRNDDHRNGVSTLDLVYIQKHLLGLETFSSPYQYIAADANNSQSVSAIDLIEIRKLILGLQDEFTQNTSWRFVAKGSPMAPGQPWPFDEAIAVDAHAETGTFGIDFIGVKVGDVNQTAQANARQILPRNGKKNLHVRAECKGRVESGDIFEIQLIFPQQITGFQWTMQTKGLEFVDVQSQHIDIGRQHVGQPESGFITMSWNGEILSSDVMTDEVVLTLTCKATEAGRLINMIQLNNAITQTEAYNEAGEVMGIKLVFASPGVFTDYALYQNKPNPFNNQTLIGFHLPAEADATLTVYDLNGQVVKTVKGRYAAGYNSVILTEQDVPASGVYYYRLESGTYVASKKMISVR